ncbi:Casparian strip membrane protein 1 [Artemisia annua]|uniref:CASP-like protein n=1 Tax=Artemisia annua TaxID=35608 RepID=A0A2U1QNQ4_ARTAN|nr:Casparian strip membrane protein 1 [Artemisia annua]
MMKSERLETGGSTSRVSARAGSNRGISLMDLILRIVGIVGTLGSSIAMGTTEQTLPFFTRFVRFNAQYDDFPSFRLFVIVNAIVCAYFVLTIPLSIVHIMRSAARGSRILLVILDTVMLGLLTAGASAATSIVYLAHNGNNSANWLAVCQQYNDFCQRASGSLIGSYGGIVVFILVILLAAIALSRQRQHILV